METYRAELEKLREDIESMEQPLGHGTTSEYLQQILETGLGAQQPEKAIAESKSVTDVGSAEGLLGAYLFSRMGETEVRVTSEEVLGRDVIDRYQELNPQLTQLRAQLEEYKSKKRPEGFPVLLIYDGQGYVELEQVNPRVPSEYAFTDTIPPDQLRCVIVPDANTQDVTELLQSEGVDTQVYPAEAVEVSDFS